MSFQEREGRPGGVKGVLVQDEHVGALATSNRQAVVIPQGGAVAVFENHQTDARTVPLDDVSPTMGAERNARPSNNNPLVVTQYDPDLAGTLRADGDHRRAAVRLDTTVAVGVAFDFRKETLPMTRECSQTRTIGTNPGFKVGVITSCGYDGWNQAGYAECSMTLRTAAGTEGDDRTPKVVTACGLDRRNRAGVDEVQPAIQSSVSDGGSTVCVGVDAYNQSETGDCSKPLTNAATDSDHTPIVLRERGATFHADRVRYEIRRLTPIECERLQGFPDNWTRIPYRGKPADQCPDSPRYRALGNSWGCNCAEWILRRLLAFGVWDGEERQE